MPTDASLKNIASEQLDVQKQIEVNTAGAPAKPPAQPSLPPKTTAEEDITTAGQRHINVMWESTQRVIAISVCTSTLILCGYLLVKGEVTERVPAFMLLSNVFFLVVGTYFQRTNHTKVGGIGNKPPEVYTGR